MNDPLRDEVRAALALGGEDPLRNCPRCGRQTRTRHERCPHCGSSYYARPPGMIRRQRVTAAVIGVIALVAFAVGTAAIVRQRHAQDRRDRIAHARLVVAEIARLHRVQAPRRGAAPSLLPPPGASAGRRLAARHRLLLAVQHSITADARTRAAVGELEGPISRSECGPFLRSPDAVPDDRVLSKPVGRYDCVAIKAHVHQDGKLVGALGYAFVAALDFRRATYVFCRNTPAQSEAGRPLAFVRLDRACLATTGRAIGSGYVDPEARP